MSHKREPPSVLNGDLHEKMDQLAISYSESYSASRYVSSTSHSRTHRTPSHQNKASKGDPAIAKRDTAEPHPHRRPCSSHHLVEDGKVIAQQSVQNRPLITRQHQSIPAPIDQTRAVTKTDKDSQAHGSRSGHQKGATTKWDPSQYGIRNPRRADVHYGPPPPGPPDTPIPAHPKSILLTPEDVAMATRQPQYKKLTKSLQAEQDVWAHKTLARLSPCPFGLKWVRVDEGYRCRMGGHGITDKLLGEGRGGMYHMPFGFWKRKYGPFYFRGDGWFTIVNGMWADAMEGPNAFAAAPPMVKIRTGGDRASS